jgi:hypothetical protein
MKLSYINHIQIFQHLLEESTIDPDSICIVAGAVTSLHRYDKINNDIDIVFSSQAKPFANQLLSSKHIDTKQNWANTVGISDDELISNPSYHIKIDGLKFARIEILFSIYQHSTRTSHITARKWIAKNISNIRDWDWSLVRLCLNNAAKRPSLKGPLNKVNRVKSGLKRLLQKPLHYTPHYSKKIVQKCKHHIRKNLYRTSSLKKNFLCTNRQEQRTPCADAHLRIQSTLIIPTGALLSLQYHNGTFQRYDIILRSLTANGIHEGSHSYKDEYHAMQIARTGTCKYDDFFQLVNSVSSDGLSPQYPIPISEEGKILDGAHRMACAIYFNLPYVHARVYQRRDVIHYGREWFSSHGFSTDTIHQLDTTLNNALASTGALYPIILWPTVAQYSEEIAQWVKQNYRTHHDVQIDLGSRFEDFVREIYRVDDIDQWKVDLKLHCMKGRGTTVRILFIEMPHTAYRNKSIEYGGNYISVEGEKIKKTIRDRYKDKIENYFYDIICHTGDNHIHNRAIFSITTQYQKASHDCT